MSADLAARDRAATVISLLRQRDLTIGTAESLTGGLACAALTSVPGASAAVRGGIVSYATEVKAEVLGVDADLLAARGPVDAHVALEMAQGVCRVLGCDVGVATTGVAGPDPQGGQPVGTVFIAVAWPGAGRTEAASLLLTGDRHQIRSATVASALHLVSRVLVDSVAG